MIYIHTLSKLSTHTHKLNLKCVVHYSQLNKKKLRNLQSVMQWIVFIQCHILEVRGCDLFLDMA